MWHLKDRLYTFLRFTERYTKTDMVYLAESGFWINLGTALVSLLSIVLYIVFARTLSPQVYGTYQYLLSGAALIGALTLTGMNYAVTRAVARGFEGTFRTSIRMQLRWGGIALLVSLLVAAYYAMSGDIVLALGFVLIAVFVPLTNALNTYTAYLAGKKDFRRLFLYTLFFNVPFYAGLMLCAIFVPGALALIATSFVIQTIAFYLAYRGTLRAHTPNDLIDEESLPYGKHLTVMNIPTTAALLVDSLLIFQILGASSLAVYAFAIVIPDRLVGFFKFLPTSLLPVLSGKTSEEARSAVSFTQVVWLVICIALIGGVYSLTAPFIFEVLFPTYAGAVPFSQLYALSMISVLGSVFGTALIAGRQIRSLYIFNTVIPVLQIVLLSLGVIFFGLWGAVWARIISAWLLVLVSAFLLYSPSRKDLQLP